MFGVITKWFGQSPKVSVIAWDVLMFAIGVLIALKSKKKSTVLWLMLCMAAVFAVCTIMLVTGPTYYNIFPVFFGATALLLFAGNLVGLIIKLLKK